MVYGNVTIELPDLPEGRYRLHKKGIDGAHFIVEKTGMSVICSVENHEGSWWIHVSGAYSDRTPTYDELAMLKADFIGPFREAYQVFPEKKDHINIHPFALHLYCRNDGCQMLPDFTMGQGSI